MFWNENEKFYFCPEMQRLLEYREETLYYGYVYAVTKNSVVICLDTGDFCIAKPCRVKYCAGDCDILVRIRYINTKERIIYAEIVQEETSG